MDFLDWLWPDDLSQVQWGPVSAWVGSLLTGVSLILGFSILWRDRSRDRRAQAREVVAWADSPETNVNLSEGRVRYIYNFSMVNNSQSLIFKPVLRVVPTNPRRLAKRLNRIYPPGFVPTKEHFPGSKRLATTSVAVFPDNHVDGDVRKIVKLVPGDSASVEVEVTHTAANYHGVITFTDAAGYQWSKDVETGTLSKYRPLD